MTFTEARAGDNLIIQIAFGKQTMDLPSKIVGVKRDNLIVDIIYLDKKMLNLASNNIRINLMLIREGKVPIVWKNVTCKIIKENEQSYYQITSYSEGYENNRREAFRLFIGNDGVAQVGINKKALEVIVRDVSENGFSFVTSTDVTMAVGEPVRLVFIDLDITFSLMGIVVRKVNVNEKEVLYGCKLSVKNNKLLKYINDKQRQEISTSKKPKTPGMGTKVSKTKKKKESKKNRYETTAEMKELLLKAFHQEEDIK